MNGHKAKALLSDFEKTALPHFSDLYTAAYYLTKNNTEAEDLVQDTYLRAFRFFENFQPGTNCRAWLLSILRRLFINLYNRTKREPETVDWDKVEAVYESTMEHGKKAGPNTLLLSELVGSDIDIKNALNELPEEHRRAIILVDVEELTYEEAAQVMGCPVGTIRSRVCRGRRMLQVQLRDYAVERLAFPLKKQVVFRRFPKNLFSGGEREVRSWLMRDMDNCCRRNAYNCTDIFHGRIL